MEKSMEIKALLPEGMEVLLTEWSQTETDDGKSVFYTESADEVIKLSAAGVKADRIYYVFSPLMEDAFTEKTKLYLIFDKCRVIADGNDSLLVVEKEAGKVSVPDMPKPVGLYVRPGLTEYNRDILRRLFNISPNGCVIDYDNPQMDSESLIANIPEAYKLVKKLTVDVPEAVPFVWFKDAGSMLLRYQKDGDAGLKKVQTALKKVVKQNTSSFGAKIITD